MSPAPPSPESGDDVARVTPIGSRRTSIAELQGEVERLTAALQLAEQRRRTAEETLAAVARMAAADAADLRRRVADLEAAVAAPAAAPVAAPEALPAPEHHVEPARARSTGRRIRRALLGTALGAGVLLIADGVVTIVWQEPVTLVRETRSQGALRTDLQDLQRTLAATPRLVRETPGGRMERQARALLHARKSGAALGTLEVPAIGVKKVFVQSTAHDALRKGPGHYSTTVLPGLDGTVALAGHRTTYGAPFRKINQLHRGSTVVLKMPYGRFVYRVQTSKITVPSDVSSLRSHPGVKRLVLTACHPLYSAAKRIVVTARLESSTPATTA